MAHEDEQMAFYNVPGDFIPESHWGFVNDLADAATAEGAFGGPGPGTYRPAQLAGERAAGERATSQAQADLIRNVLKEAGEAGHLDGKKGGFWRNILRFLKEMKLGAGFGVPDDSWRLGKAKTDPSFARKLGAGAKAGAGSVIAGLAAEELLNGGRGGGGGLGGGSALGRISEAEAQALERRGRLETELSEQLEKDMKGGRPPVMRINLEDPVDPEKFWDRVGSPAERKAMQAVLAAFQGQGSVATLGQAELLAQRQGRDEEMVGGLLEKIIDSMLA